MQKFYARQKLMQLQYFINCSLRFNNLNSERAAISIKNRQRRFFYQKRRKTPSFSHGDIRHKSDLKNLLVMKHPYLIFLVPERTGKRS